jgi:hypothetical protein
MPATARHATLAAQRIVFGKLKGLEVKYRQPCFGYPRCKQTGHYAYARTSVASKSYEPTGTERRLRCKQHGILLRNKEDVIYHFLSFMYNLSLFQDRKCLLLTFNQTD